MTAEYSEANELAVGHLVVQDADNDVESLLGSIQTSYDDASELSHSRAIAGLSRITPSSPELRQPQLDYTPLQPWKQWISPFDAVPSALDVGQNDAHCVRHPQPTAPGKLGAKRRKAPAPSPARRQYNSPEGTVLRQTPFELGDPAIDATARKAVGRNRGRGAKPAAEQAEENKNLRLCARSRGRQVVPAVLQVGVSQALPITWRSARGSFLSPRAGPPPRQQLPSDKGARRKKGVADRQQLGSPRAAHVTLQGRPPDHHHDHDAEYQMSHPANAHKLHDQVAHHDHNFMVSGKMSATPRLPTGEYLSWNESGSDGAGSTVATLPSTVHIHISTNVSVPSVSSTEVQHGPSDSDRANSKESHQGAPFVNISLPQTPLRHRGGKPVDMQFDGESEADSHSDNGSAGSSTTGSSTLRTMTAELYSMASQKHEEQRRKLQMKLAVFGYREEDDDDDDDEEAGSTICTRETTRREQQQGQNEATKSSSGASLGSTVRGSLLSEADACDLAALAKWMAWAMNSLKKEESRLAAAARIAEKDTQHGTSRRGLDKAMFGSLTAPAGALARMVRELRESQRIAAGAMAVALEDALPGRLYFERHGSSVTAALQALINACSMGILGIEAAAMSGGGEGGDDALGPESSPSKPHHEIRAEIRDALESVEALVAKAIIIIHGELRAYRLRATVRALRSECEAADNLQEVPEETEIAPEEQQPDYSSQLPDGFDALSSDVLVVQLPEEHDSADEDDAAAHGMAAASGSVAFDDTTRAGPISRNLEEWVLASEIRRLSAREGGDTAIKPADEAEPLFTGESNGGSDLFSPKSFSSEGKRRAETNKYETHTTMGGTGVDFYYRAPKQQDSDAPAPRKATTASIEASINSTKSSRPTPQRARGVSVHSLELSASQEAASVAGVGDKEFHTRNSVAGGGAFGSAKQHKESRAGDSEDTLVEDDIVAFALERCALSAPLESPEVTEERARRYAAQVKERWRASSRLVLTQALLRVGETAPPTSRELAMLAKGHELLRSDPFAAIETMLPALKLLVAAKKGVQDCADGVASGLAEPPLQYHGGTEVKGEEEGREGVVSVHSPLAPAGEDEDAASVVSYANQSTDSYNLLGDAAAAAAELSMVRHLSPTANVPAHGSPEHLASGAAIGADLHLNIKSLQSTKWTVEGALHKINPRQMRSVHWDAPEPAVEKDMSPTVPIVLVRPISKTHGMEEASEGRPHLKRVV
jgi:hypothetical protein